MKQYHPAVTATGRDGTPDTAGPLVSTFSIVGYDPEYPAWGIAIASRFLAVGARTCWGAPHIGVAVVQAHLNANNGREAIELQQQGVSAAEVLDRLMDKDPHRDLRQMASIDGQGRVATYTGRKCGDWAGGILGKHCAAQGNMLVSGAGCQAMVESFEQSRGSLARRLVDALAQGDRMGGDSRGRQSTALFVVRPVAGSSFDVFTEPTIDLRVDDHVDPHGELSRLLDLYELLYYPTEQEERMELNGETLGRLQTALKQLGYYAGDITGVMTPALNEALQAVSRRENLRRRITLPLESVDRRMLAYLEQRADQSA